MASGISLPKQWEDWANWILGIWLCLSPFALGFSFETRMTENAVIVGFLLIFAEVVTLSVFRPWEEWIGVVLGAWLVISPFVLGGGSAVPTANFIIVGLLVMALALYEIREARRQPQ
jgi:hypothetical protein